jgi:signal transduction histidine kinase
VFFNQNKAQMLGFPPERFKQYIDFTKLVHPEDYENTMDAFRKHLNGELPVYQCKYRIQNSENNYVWFYDVGKIVAQDVENMRITGIVINISEQMKFEQYMTQNNATKDKLISILTHDLKNPFDSIIAYSELLYNNFKEFSPEKLENTIKTIFEITKNTHNLLENLLVWTHLQSDKIKYSPQILNLNELINENYNLFTPNLLAKNIAFENHTSQLLNLFVDKTTINLVLKNILSNAIKFTNSSGKIQIFTQQINDLTVEIRISDSGIGIPENILKNLFKIEKSFSSHGTDNEVGTGLGLILTNEFVKNNSGKISIKSKEGIGTEVYLQLPLYNKVSSFDHLSRVYNNQFMKKIHLSLENELPSFMHYANTELFTIWEELNQSISIEKIEIAKNKLFHLAHQFNSSLLLELANEIQNSLMNFSINEIYFFIKFFMQMKKEFEN